MACMDRLHGAARKPSSRAIRLSEYQREMPWGAWMRQTAKVWMMAMSLLVSGSVVASAQTPAPTSLQSAPPSANSAPTASQPGTVITGGKLHGVVKSGIVPLPGVTLTAQNTLTGKRYSTTTDVTGAWSMTIPQNGRYVVRTQFAGFANGSQEGLLNAASHDQAVSFDLMLASGAARRE